MHYIDSKRVLSQNCSVVDVSTNYQLNKQRGFGIFNFKIHLIRVTMHLLLELLLKYDMIWHTKCTLFFIASNRNCTTQLGK